MSAKASNLARNSPPALTDSPLEVVRLTPGRQEALQRFFAALEAASDGGFFSPHPADADAIGRIAAHDGQDVYCLAMEQGEVLGYGLLRGWDEGYAVPSLGLAVHPCARGMGLGRLLMEFLHVQVVRKGADKVRLRVRIDNSKAIQLYKGLGYIFETDARQSDLLVGFKSLEHV